MIAGASRAALETPLTGLPAIIVAILASIVIHLVVLVFLALRRVRFTEALLVLFCLGLTAGAPGFIVVPFALEHFHGWYPIWSVPTEYPVFVSCPGEGNTYDSQVVQWSLLSALRKANPQCTFLVPKGEDLELPGGSYCHVTRISDTRQQIIVSRYLKNGLVESWYEASMTNIFPRYIRTQGSYEVYLRDAGILVLVLDSIALAIYAPRPWKAIRFLLDQERSRRLGSIF